MNIRRPIKKQRLKDNVEGANDYCEIFSKEMKKTGQINSRSIIFEGVQNEKNHI